MKNVGQWNDSPRLSHYQQHRTDLHGGHYNKVDYQDEYGKEAGKLDWRAVVVDRVGRWSERDYRYENT